MIAHDIGIAASWTSWVTLTCAHQIVCLRPYISRQTRR